MWVPSVWYCAIFVFVDQVCYFHEAQRSGSFVSVNKHPTETSQLPPLTSRPSISLSQRSPTHCDHTHQPDYNYTTHNKHLNMSDIIYC